jgi:hypothetical protein
LERSSVLSTFKINGIISFLFLKTFETPDMEQVIEIEFPNTLSLKFGILSNEKLLDILKGIEDVTSKDFWFDLSVR